MAEPDYRYYRLDGADRLHDAEFFWAASDDDAIAQIRARHPDSTSEIWQRRRLVARVLRKRADPDDPELQRAVGERLSALALRIRLGKEHWGWGPALAGATVDGVIGSVFIRANLG